MPVNVLDLFVEFRNHTNGLPVPCGAGLIGALAWFGLNSIGIAEKDTMRDLIISGGPWSESEKIKILDYCQTDVDALANLLPKMERHLDLPRAILRGRYMKAAAVMEHNGVPVDSETLEQFREHWETIQAELIREIDKDFLVFEGRTFKVDRWAQWLIDNEIPWPRLPSGALDLKDDTFRQMARAFPAVAPMRELRVSLSQMRLSELAVGPDSRNRCLLSPFRAKTGRNQPSNAKFIFGPAVWLRGLIKPRSGYGLAYVDWSQQEFGIAGALSGDLAMMNAYQSGDPYLAFAKQAGAAPDEATKKTHGAIREQFKACVLAVQYGMGEESLAQRIGQPVIRARELLRLHQETYRDFWAWSGACVDYANLHGKLWTVFGWNLNTGRETKSRTLQNYPMQANGAEMLRLACCLVVEAGITVCAPIHDAILIEAPLNELPNTINRTQALMAEASRVVLSGFELRTDADVIRYPDRYEDGRGQVMWRTVADILSDILRPQTCALAYQDLLTGVPTPVRQCAPGPSY
ncbi:DNA polymerase [Gammaproteobacteria bacterium]|nr:DNA polymerase [Gammaproteobacteria bacterium]